jgi:hypothetical protein
VEEELRTPFFVAALVLIAVAVLVEVGSELVSGLGLSGRIGLGIPYMALVDGMLLYMIMLMALALGLSERLHGLLQGPVTLVLSLLVALASFIMIFAALFALTEMLALLLAIPFGTIVYAILFGHFARGPASAELSTIMTLKLLFAGCLVAAQQRFLENKLLVFTIALALLATIIVGFLQGLVPIFLVSITDAIAAIILAILGLVLAIILLLRSIPAVVKAIA